MTTRSAERAEFLGDIIIAAVEGGTGHWAAVSGYKHAVSTDVSAVLHELNDDETGYKDEGLTLDIDAIARAIGKIKRGEVQINGQLGKLILDASAENDAGDIDAGAADVLAQIGLLGEIVYG